MKRFAHSLIGMLALCAGMVLFSTGCAKEELVAPAAPADLVKHTSAGATHEVIDHTRDVDNRTLISDDGDDQGDKESTIKPSGH